MKIKQIEALKNYLKNSKKLQQETLALNQLQKLFSESSFIPLTRFSISPSAILCILNDIVINNRQQIIEFGSGVSTLYIAKLIDTLKLDAKFYSVESNPDWAKQQYQVLKLYKLQDKVKIILAPIVQVEKTLTIQDQCLWYDPEIIISEISDLNEIDLAVVDGPGGGTTPYARYSALPVLRKKLSNNFSLYLDDIDRSEEAEIFYEWHKQLDCKTFRQEKFGCLYSENSFVFRPLMI